MFSYSFFSVNTHITVINNNINDNKEVPRPPINNHGALTNSYGTLGPLTENQGGLGRLDQGSLTNYQGTPNQQPGTPN